ncbi:MAG: MMPL family transporter [Longimicrobiales bacterium]|nr:MMPL family transporter [Longimicrobiales bacterium]
MLRLPELCHPVRRFRKTILGVAAVATLVGGWLSSRLELNSDFAALLPETFASARALEAIGEQVVWTSHFRIALETQDFEAALAFARDVTPRLEASAWVRAVAYQNDVEFYERNALLFVDVPKLDSLRDAVRTAIDARKQSYNPLMVDDLFGENGDGEDDGFRTELLGWQEEYRASLPKRYYANPSRTVLVLDVSPAQEGSDLAYDRAMAADVRRIVEETDPSAYAPDMQVRYGGNINNRVTELETVTADVLGTAGFGVSGVFLLLAVAFRSVIIASLISLSLVASLAWTFGLTYLVLGQLNTITGFLFVVLFGLGVDFGIHAMARYKESRQAGADSHAAVHAMVCQVGPALLTSALTTAAAFFSLLLLQFRGFSELGLITGVGMLFAVASVLVVLPALVILAEDLGVLRIERVEGKALTGPKGRLPFARTIVAAGTLLTLASAYAFTRVPFQYDFTELRIITPERQEYARVVEGVFPMTESPAVVLTASAEQAEEVVAAVETIARADTLSPTVASVLSVRSLVPARQDEKLDRIRALRRLVSDEADAGLDRRDQERVDRLNRLLQVDEPFTWADFPAQDRERFTAPDGGPGDFVLIYPSVPLRDGRNAMAFRDDVGTVEGASGTVYHAASPNIIVADLLTMITREGPLAVLLSLAVVFLIIFVGAGSWKSALLVMSPLVFGLVWTGGLMYAAGMQLNFFNMVVFPSLVGIGVDEGVHIHHRYREEGPGSLPFVLRRTGMAVTLTTLTTIVGYAGLLFAHHPGLRAIGTLAVVGLTAAFLSAVLVLPAMIEVFEGGARADA